jgi:hypothetical protein
VSTIDIVFSGGLIAFVYLVAFGLCRSAGAGSRQEEDWAAKELADHLIATTKSTGIKS